VCTCVCEGGREREKDRGRESFRDSFKHVALLIYTEGSLLIGQILTTGVCAPFHCAQGVRGLFTTLVETTNSGS